MPTQNPMLNRYVGLATTLGTVLICLQKAVSADPAVADFLSLPGTNRIALIRFGPAVFQMGCPRTNRAPAPLFSQEAARPEHQVSLRRFWIGKYPVTVSQYCEFLNSVGFRAEFTESHALLKDFVAVGSARFKPKLSRLQFPVAGVTPAGAKAFCEWVSAVSHRKCRLPTEAEWEFVAKGERGRTYPWGEALRTTNPEGCAVGANPSLATPEGVEDLNGPVWQYCLDMYDAEFYKQSPSENPVCTNGDWQVVRGGPMGKFMERLTHTPTWERFGAREVNRLSGFRIAVEDE